MSSKVCVSVCLSFAVLAFGLVGGLVPGVMFNNPAPAREIPEVPAVLAAGLNPVAARQEPQQDDTTPQAQSNRLTDYHSARWDPIHFQPAILEATNQDCLKCHNEILSRRVLAESPAGLKASETLAWYQTLDTYEGDQQSFHWRHLESPYAKNVMNLKCNFCHKGNDPREEAPPTSGDPAGFTLRKMVDTQDTCLRCHSQMNWTVMTLPTPMQGPWHQVRDSYQNDCLSCHAIYRTVRHQVSYLNAGNIEELAKPENLGGDVCYGCHGGRAWYREGYPYPRHEYPGMDQIPEPYPEWAKDRPVVSDPEYALPIEMPAVPTPPAEPAVVPAQEGTPPQSQPAGVPPTANETTDNTGAAAGQPPAATETQNSPPAEGATSDQGAGAASPESTDKPAAGDEAENKEAGK